MVVTDSHDSRDHMILVHLSHALSMTIKTNGYGSHPCTTITVYSRFQRMFFQQALPDQACVTKTWGEHTFA